MSQTAIPKTPVIWEVPQLAIDKKMKEEFGSDVHPRGRLERRLVWNLLAHLAKHGWQPVEVRSDEDVKTPTAMDVMEEVFNLDDAWVAFQKNGTGPMRCIFIVLGNDGWDAISDWRYGTGDPDGFNAVMEAFDGEDYC